MEKVTSLGIDLAKSVFSLHGVDGKGQVVLRRTVRRDQLVKVVAGRCSPRTNPCARSEHQRLPRLQSTMTNRSNRRPENLIIFDGVSQCRLTSEDRTCGFHQGQSIHCSKTGRL